VQEYPVSFLKTYNDVGFNFSMLNNIAASVCHKIGAKRIILWNSDLWIDKIEYFKQLIQLHEKENSTISGSKLLYPVVSLHENHSPNIKKHFPDKLDGSYKDTVQFGGSRWVPSSFSTNKGQIHTFLPYHYKRFSNKNNPLVNSNYATVFVTGALQVIELDWFISIGGLNPSLSKNFQDVDLCLRAIENEKKVMYFGKDIHFYHDESYTFYKVGSKKQEEINSNQAFFSNLWKDKIIKIIF
jgi:GT2 family glycosyltransferase